MSVMLNREFFYNYVRVSLFNGKLKQSQVNGLETILNEWEANYAQKDDRWLAYMLATTHHETDRTIKPIEEYGKGKKKAYGQFLKMTRNKAGKRIPYSNTTELFYGRGFVQLTWYENYAKASKKLNQDFLHDASKVMLPENATKIMFIGMMEGWFTTKKLSDYFNATKTDWYNARRIINGIDKAKLIADYAFNYYAAMSYTI
jgi:putative chitinase